MPFFYRCAIRFKRPGARQPLLFWSDHLGVMARTTHLCNAYAHTHAHSRDHTRVHARIQELVATIAGTHVHAHERQNGIDDWLRVVAAY